MIVPDRGFPKISCLMVTAAGRTDEFDRSFRCFADQTYPNRELVVVNEGPPEYQRWLAARVLGRDDVRLVFLDGRYTLGALRNVSVALSAGDLFVQWDDDDFNAPERLAAQYHRLRRQPGARACYLTDQLHYFFPTRELFWNDWSAFHGGGRKEYSLIPGTLMAYRDGFHHRYPSVGGCAAAGEDSVLALAALEDEDAVLLVGGLGHLHVYSYHGRNVWDLEHHRKIARERALPVARLLSDRDKVSATLSYLRLGGPVAVLGRDGFAFAWEGP